MTGQITATQITDGAISTPKLAAESVTAATIAAAAITAGKIAVGAVGADQIAANAITAKHLLISDFSNMVVNDWSQGNLDGWTFEGLQGSGFAMVGFRVWTNRRNACVGPWQNVNGNEEYHFSIFANNEDASYGVAVQCQIETTDGSVSTFRTAARSDVRNSWVKVQGIVQMPGNARRARFYAINEMPGGATGGLTYWNSPVMRRAAGGELIVDGAITAAKISAGAVTADAILAGAIIASKLAAGSVTANALAANSVTAAKIEAGSITAAKMAAGSITAENGAIANLAVDTLQIAGQAVTIPVSAFTEANLTSSESNVMQTVVINRQGYKTDIDASVLILSAFSTTEQQTIVQIRRNGTAVVEYLVPHNSLQIVSFSTTDETLGTGNTTYTLWVGGNVAGCRKRYLKAQQTKR